MITVTFVQPNGDEYTYDAEIGDTLMDVAVDNGVDGIIASVVGLFLLHRTLAARTLDRAVRAGNRR